MLAFQTNKNKKSAETSKTADEKDDVIREISDLFGDQRRTQGSWNLVSDKTLEDGD